RVPYSDGAMRFWGATFDPSGLYRFGAAMDWMQAAGATPAAVHEHAQQLQERFLGGLASIGSSHLAAAHLAPGMGIERGNFLTFDVDGAEALHQRIVDAGIYIDRRSRRLRFGFGVYHDASHVDALTGKLGAVLR